MANDKSKEDEIDNDKKEIFSISVSSKDPMKIQRFPDPIHGLICKWIKVLLEQGNNKTEIVPIILNELETNKNSGENSNDRTFIDLQRKIGMEKYRKAILIYFKWLVDVIDFLIKNPLMSLRKVNKIFNSHSVGRIAKTIFSKSEYDDRYILNQKKIPEDQFLLIQTLNKVLDSKKNLINSDPIQFIPTKENIIKEDSELLKLDSSRFNDALKWWINKNTEYNGITDLKRSCIGKEDFEYLYNILDRNKSKIISGEFIPISRNLAKIDKRFNHKNIHHVATLVSSWLKKNTKYNNLSALLTHFNPSPTKLGYTKYDFEKKIIKYGKKLIKKLDFEVPENFFDIVMTIYQDILNSITPNNNRSRFDILYEKIYKKKSLKMDRDERFFVAVLIYYSLLFWVYSSDKPYEKKRKLIHKIEFNYLANSFDLGFSSIVNLSKPVRSFLEKIPKYQNIFKNILLKKYSDYSIDYIRNTFDFKINRMNYIKDKELRTILLEFFTNFEEDFSSSFFNGLYPRASDFQLAGTMKRPLSYKSIKNFFVNSSHLVKEINRSHELFFICKITQRIYNLYDTEHFGREGHKIVTNFFLDSECFSFYKKKNFFPISKELPVWKVISLDKGITGHIDNLAIYYHKDCLNILILDFKPGKGMLRSIIQLVIYGFLLRRQIHNTSVKHGLQMGKYNIKCVMFNKTKAFIFDPYEIWSFIFKYIDTNIHDCFGTLKEVLIEKLKDFDFVGK